MESMTILKPFVYQQLVPQFIPATAPSPDALTMGIMLTVFAKL